MRFGTPPRPAHRATADGGLAVLVRPGQHRLASAPPLVRARPKRHATHPVPPARRHTIHPIPPTRRHATRQRRAAVPPQHAAHLLIRGIAALIMLGLAVMIGVLTVADRQTRDPVTLAPAGRAVGDLFPGQLRPAGADGPYRTTATDVDADCRASATGVLATQLRDHGCTRVVRAALAAPYGDYRVTAGVVELTDPAAAAEVDDRLRELVEGGDGGFATLGTGGDPALAQVGWRARGQYVLYCVITRPDGELVRNDDPYAARITTELVDGHLAAAAG